MQTVSDTTKPIAASFGDYVDLLRPHQWVKNVVVLAGPAAALKLAVPGEIWNVLLTFMAFCFAASATYTVNDVLDRTADARHPVKCRRPLARGAISPSAALTVGACLVVLALAIPFAWLGPKVTAVIGTYFVMTLAYSLALKRRMILDVIILATGFVLRAWAGSLAVDVATSEWLVACMFTLCLFMGFGKRRCELAMLGTHEAAGEHRRTLKHYTPQLLTHLITVSAGMAIVTFLLYTMDASQPSAFQKEHLFYTLPLVVYGVFRFAMLSELGTFSGPTEIVLRDRPMLGVILLWALCALLIAYQDSVLGEGGISRWLGQTP